MIYNDRHIKDDDETQQTEFSLHTLFPHLNQSFFNSPYWNFSCDIFTTYLNLANIDQILLEEDQLQVDDTVVFDKKHKKWRIDLSFYEQVSKRFNDARPPLITATCLYILHEAIHSQHRLNNYTVNGIGNFPRIVEDADYQADAIAILVMWQYKISQLEGNSSVSNDDLLDTILDLIKNAIETTYSFNPLDKDLELIQVRRVNRYFIWFKHYYDINQLFGESSLSQDELILRIFKLFELKPIIEVSGPEIKSNKLGNRTFYNLNKIVHTEEVAVLTKNNIVKRIAKGENIKFEELYQGIKSSNFDRVLNFFHSVFEANPDE